MDADAVLRSAIHGIISDAQNATGDAVRRNDAAMAVRKLFGSSARIDEAWKLIQTNGIDAAYKMIDACISIGAMRDAAQIDAIVIPEYECFLRSWNVASAAGAAVLDQREDMLRTNARTLVSRIQSEVRTRAYAAQQRDAKEAAALEAMKPKQPAPPAPWWTHLGPLTKIVEALLRIYHQLF